MKLIRNKSHSAFLVGMFAVDAKGMVGSPVGMLMLLSLKGLGRRDLRTGAEQEQGQERQQEDVPKV